MTGVQKCALPIYIIKVGEVIPQAGSILANHSYQFNNVLDSVSPGTISYRIRQIIDTSATTFAALYIDTANVNLSSTCPIPSGGGNLIYLYPNPTSSQVTLVVETNFAVNDMPVNVYDMKGRLMLKLKFSKGTGKATFDLPIGRLAKGKYNVVVFNKNIRLGTAGMIRL